MFLEGVENERETRFSKIPSQEPKMMCVPHRQRRDCHASPACWVCVGGVVGSHVGPQVRSSAHHTCTPLVFLHGFTFIWYEVAGDRPFSNKVTGKLSAQTVALHSPRRHSGDSPL